MVELIIEKSVCDPPTPLWQADTLVALEVAAQERGQAARESRGGQAESANPGVRGDLWTGADPWADRPHRGDGQEGSFARPSISRWSTERGAIYQ